MLCDFMSRMLSIFFYEEKLMTQNLTMYVLTEKRKSTHIKIENIGFF
jgi:hypothetical protein